MPCSYDISPRDRPEAACRSANTPLLATFVQQIVPLVHRIRVVVEGRGKFDRIPKRQTAIEWPADAWQATVVEHVWFADLPERSGQAARLGFVESIPADQEIFALAGAASMEYPPIVFVEARVRMRVPVTDAENSIAGMSGACRRELPYLPILPVDDDRRMV